MICEVRQTIWVETPKGTGRVKFIIDAGDDADLQWVCFYPNGEIWTWLNSEVRVVKNITMKEVEKRKIFKS